HILGTNLWNVPGIGRRAGIFANNLLFVDSFFSGDTRPSVRSLIGGFRSTFGEDPTVLELQAIDTALLVQSVLRSGANSRSRFASVLLENPGFQGSISHLTLNETREFVRPLISLGVSSDQIVPKTK
ncbi:MAG: hypothetical protein N2578_07020, partial [Bdellovibrionaceae bacterium]|nr:hypothetical protein [Pseudobdellovibrionaceae bacterium]